MQYRSSKAPCPSVSSNLKLVFNHTHASFDGGAPGGRDREDEKTFFSRLQVSV